MAKYKDGKTPKVGDVISFPAGKIVLGEVHDISRDGFVAIQLIVDPAVCETVELAPKKKV